MWVCNLHTNLIGFHQGLTLHSTERLLRSLSSWSCYSLSTFCLSLLISQIQDMHGGYNKVSPPSHGITRGPVPSSLSSIGWSKFSFGPFQVQLTRLKYTCSDASRQLCSWSQTCTWKPLNWNLIAAWCDREAVNWRHPAWFSVLRVTLLSVQLLWRFDMLLICCTAGRSRGSHPCRNYFSMIIYPP